LLKAGRNKQVEYLEAFIRDQAPVESGVRCFVERRRLTKPSGGVEPPAGLRITMTVKATA
jgi:hypothetical protein